MSPNSQLRQEQARHQRSGARLAVSTVYPAPGLQGQIVARDVPAGWPLVEEVDGDDYACRWSCSEASVPRWTCELRTALAHRRWDDRDRTHRSDLEFRVALVGRRLGQNGMIGTVHYQPRAALPILASGAGGTCLRCGRCRSGRTAALVMVLLPILVGLVGCGATNSARPLSPANVIKRRLEATTPRELADLVSSPKGPTLARVGLPGGDAISIVAMPCVAAGADSCYRFAEYWEEPARYARATHGQQRGMVKRFAGTGSMISNAGPAERVPLDMAVSHDCAGRRPFRYPYAFAQGLLRGVNDVVTDRASGTTITMNTAIIPARIHPEGVLVYGLLLPGPNDVLVRTPTGRVVSRRRWAGSDEEVSCDNR